MALPLSLFDPELVDLAWFDWDLAEGGAFDESLIGLEVDAPVTIETIRDRIIALIQALTPARVAGVGFRHSLDEGGADFVQWAEENPASAFRRFQVRDDGEDEPPLVSGFDADLHRVKFIITVAYPHDKRAGASGLRSREDLMDSDWKRINWAVGAVGRGNFSGSNDCTPVVALKNTERGENCDFLRIEAEYTYYLEHDLPVFVTRDGPNSVMMPATYEEWLAIGNDIRVPNYFWRGQELSGDIADEVQGAVMANAASPEYRQSLSNWKQSWLRISETATEGFFGAAGALWNTNVQSVVYTFYFRLNEVPSGVRVLAMLSGANGYVSINGFGRISLVNSGTVSGTYNYADGAEHFCRIEYQLGSGVLGHTGAGVYRVSTDKEQVTGTWEVIPDDIKGLGGCGTFTPPDVYFGAQEVYVGSDAEAMIELGVADEMRFRGWSLAY